jgi:GntR family transcriptional regulator/MocR family aminotransferase
LASRASLPLDLLLERNSDEPIHRQIYVALRKYILDGRLAAEANLPGSRLMAQHLGISRNTVLAAYDQLLGEGYVAARSGSGTFVVPRLAQSPPAPRAAEAQFRLSRRGELIASQPQPCRTRGRICLYPGVPETRTFPFAVWSRLLARNGKRQDDDLLAIHSYCGHPALRQAIAEYVGVARGVECTADQVIVTTGAQAALDLIARILLDAGHDVWMEEPGYLGARSALLAGGARLWPLRVGPQGWSLEDPDLPPPHLVYVTPSCHWPLGSIMRMEERLRLLGLAERHKAWIVEDDYDGEYRFRGRPVPALRGLAHSDRVIYVGTFGKTMFPTLRLGFLVVPRELALPFDRAMSVTGQFAPSPLQAAVADFIRQGHFANHLRRMRRLYARRQQTFVALCQRHLARWLTIEENESGMQLLGRFAMPLDDREVTRLASAAGIDVQSVSINYHSDTPRHGLLFGYAALDEAEAARAVAALRDVFRDAERAGSGRIEPSEAVPARERKAVLLPDPSRQ